MLKTIFISLPLASSLFGIQFAKRNYMKKSFIFAFCFLVHFYGISQEQLINYYSEYAEVHGGMEDSGITRQEKFYFHALETIELQDVWYENKPLTLAKGDTIIIAVAHFTPYHDKENEVDHTKTAFLEKRETKKSTTSRFTVYFDGHYYYLTYQASQKWDERISYRCVNQVYTSKTKCGFDTGQTSYAP